MLEDIIADFVLPQPGLRRDASYPRKNVVEL